MPSVIDFLTSSLTRHPWRSCYGFFLVPSRAWIFDFGQKALPSVTDFLTPLLTCHPWRFCYAVCLVPSGAGFFILDGDVQKVKLAVVELVETTIFSAMVITYWTAPSLIYFLCY